MPTAAASAEAILLVDSDCDSLAMYSSLLKFSGWRVHTCADESEAVANALECRPAAVVFGLGIPGGPSLDALRELRQHPATWHLPVLVTTTSPRAAVRQAVEDLGAHAVLLKPVTPTELLLAINDVLHGAVAC
jgi:CheY-like chemotaxis protein